VSDFKQMLKNVTKIWDEQFTLFPPPLHARLSFRLFRCMAAAASASTAAGARCVSSWLMDSMVLAVGRE